MIRVRLFFTLRWMFWTSTSLHVSKDIVGFVFWSRVFPCFWQETTMKSPLVQDSYAHDMAQVQVRDGQWMRQRAFLIVFLDNVFCTSRHNINQKILCVLSSEVCKMVLLWKVLLSKWVACVGRILKAPSNEFRLDANTSGTIDMQDGLGSEMVAKLAKATFASSCFGEYIEGRVACVETLLTWLHASLPLNLLKLKAFFFPAFMHFNAASVASLVLILCNFSIENQGLQYLVALRTRLLDDYLAACFEVRNPLIRQAGQSDKDAIGTLPSPILDMRQFERVCRKIVKVVTESWGKISRY